MTEIKPSTIIMMGEGVRGQGVGQSLGPRMVERWMIERSVDTCSTGCVVSVLSGLPGVGVFVPYVRFSYEWPLWWAYCPLCPIWVGWAVCPFTR